MNGKGDKRRPTDENKFRENFDEINWTKGPGFVIRHIRSQSCPVTDLAVTQCGCSTCMKDRSL